MPLIGDERRCLPTPTRQRITTTHQNVIQYSDIKTLWLLIRKYDNGITFRISLFCSFVVCASSCSLFETSNDTQLTHKVNFSNEWVHSRSVFVVSTVKAMNQGKILTNLAKWFQMNSWRRHSSLKNRQNLTVEGHRVWPYWR